MSIQIYSAIWIQPTSVFMSLFRFLYWAEDGLLYSDWKSISVTKRTFTVEFTSVKTTRGHTHWIQYRKLYHIYTAALTAKAPSRQCRHKETYMSRWCDPRWECSHWGRNRRLLIRLLGIRTDRWHPIPHRHRRHHLHRVSKQHTITGT